MCPGHTDQHRNKRCLSDEVCTYLLQQGEMPQSCNTHMRVMSHGVCERQCHQSTVQSAAALRQTVHRERDMSDRERRAGSPASSAGRICNEIKAHMITREKQAWLWSCVIACAHHQNPKLHALSHADKTQHWPSFCGHTHDTKLHHVRPGYALCLLAHPSSIPIRLHSAICVSSLPLAV